MTPPDREAEKRRAAEAALELVKEGMVLGLGTGSTMRYFLERLGDKAVDGFEVKGVPTSIATATFAKEHGIALTSLEESPTLDLAVDGADEIGPDMTLIKGGGGALFREKIVAAAAKRFVVVADGSKLVKRLGERAPVPAEVSPFGWRVSKVRLEALGCTVTLRESGGATMRTDNGNYLFDARFRSIKDPAEAERAIKVVPGIVECGLFVGMAHLALVGGPKGVRKFTRGRS